MSTSQSFNAGKSSQQGLAHIFLIIILLFGIISGVYLVQKTQIFKPKASEGTQLETSSIEKPDIQTLTNSLIEAGDNYNNEFSTLSLDSKLQKLQEMIDLAKIRKEGLVKELERDPKLFLEHATLADQRDKLPQEVQNYIEKQVTLQGELAVGHKDDFNNKQAIPFYNLETNNDVFSLYFAQTPNEIQTGDTVAIQKGVSLGSAIAVPKDSSNFKTLTTNQRGDPEDLLRGTISVGVVLMKFSETPSMVYSENKIEEIMFGQTNSVADYYKKNTYGKISIVGDMLGTVVIPQNNGMCDDQDINLWTKEANNFINAQSIKRDSYYSIVYVLPPNNICQKPGWSNGGRSKNSAAGVWIAKADVDYTLSAFVHELGHSLFLDHANLRICNGSEKCESREYWDFFDPMGSAQDKVFHMNIIHKEQLKSIKPTIVLPSTSKVVYPTRTYKILPIEKSPPLVSPIQENNMTVVQGLLMPVIVSDKRGAEYYYFEYRRHLDYDDQLPAAITSGVLIHTWAREERYTNLIPPDEKNTNGNKFALSDGQIFRMGSNENGMFIKQLSHDETGVIVEISRDFDEH